MRERALAFFLLSGGGVDLDLCRARERERKKEDFALLAFPSRLSGLLSWVRDGSSRARGRGCNDFDEFGNGLRKHERPVESDAILFTCSAPKLRFPPRDPGASLVALQMIATIVRGKGKEKKGIKTHLKRERRKGGGGRRRWREGRRRRLSG